MQVFIHNLVFWLVIFLQYKNLTYLWYGTPRLIRDKFFEK
jgi:hypothetical protein